MYRKSVYFVVLSSLFAVTITTELYPNPCDNEFYCTNGACIWPGYVCNGYDDCGDNSDERSCHGCPSSASFSCGTGECIDPVKVCDDNCDCFNCFDEEREYCFNKTSPSPCHTNQFWCSNNRCRKKDRVCNGQDNCGDASDERSCDGCDQGEFACSENSSHGGKNKCIDPAKVCDTICDCKSCNDEEQCYTDPNDKFVFSSLIGLYIMAAVMTLVLIALLIRQKYKHKRSRNQNVTNVTNTFHEMGGADDSADQPDILHDLPPDYDTLVDNPVFIMDSDSLQAETDEELPTYEEANSGLYITSQNVDVEENTEYETIYDNITLEQETDFTVDSETTSQNPDQSSDIFTTAASGNNCETSTDRNSQADSSNCRQDLTQEAHIPAVADDNDCPLATDNINASPSHSDDECEATVSNHIEPNNDLVPAITCIDNDTDDISANMVETQSTIEGVINGVIDTTHNVNNCLKNNNFMTDTFPDVRNVNVNNQNDNISETSDASEDYYSYAYNDIRTNSFCPRHGDAADECVSESVNSNNSYLTIIPND